MINLLPGELKEEYLYARRNSKLRRWAFALLFALVGVGVVTTAGMLYLQGSIDNYSHKVIASQDTLKDLKLDQTREQAEDINNSIKLATDVLSREILFSKLLSRIASVMPANTSLTNLSITDTQGGLDITAGSSNYASATQLQVNLSDPKNEIFTKADIQSIICGGATPDSPYPCTINLRALFGNDNPYLFINKGGTTK